MSHYYRIVVEVPDGARDKFEKFLDENVYAEVDTDVFEARVAEFASTLSGWEQAISSPHVQYSKFVEFASTVSTDRDNRGPQGGIRDAV